MTSLWEFPYVINYVDKFHATGFFLYPLKTSENVWYSDIFWGYGKRPVAVSG